MVRIEFLHGIERGLRHCNTIQKKIMLRAAITKQQDEIREKKFSKEE
jgi:hypothetical protein